MADRRRAASPRTRGPRTSRAASPRTLRYVVHRGMRLRVIRSEKKKRAHLSMMNLAITNHYSHIIRNKLIKKIELDEEELDMRDQELMKE